MDGSEEHGAVGGGGGAGGAGAGEGGLTYTEESQAFLDEAARGIEVG